MFLMFENFTERAIKVIMLAQEEARLFGNSHVGIEQLFLALLGQSTGTASTVLKAAGLTLREVREQIQTLKGKGSGFVAPEIPFTPGAKRGLERAIEEARTIGHNYVDTEHLLLGTLAEDDGIISRVLSTFGSNKDRIRSELLRGMTDDEAARLATGAERSRSTPTLKEFATDLTEKSLKGGLDPVVGREKEIERVIQILARRTKSNPMLIGEPGVGKTAIAEALAQRIVDGNVPPMLENKRVCVLDVGLLVAGTKYRGEFEDRLNKVLADVTKAGDIILVIDELHTLIGAGAGEGALDAANLLKPALARGEFLCLGATTLDEYRKHFEKDGALERRFQPVLVQEPTKNQTLEILRGLSSKYESFHRLKYAPEALQAAVNLADRYIPDRHLPDKAIDLVDEAGSLVKITATTDPDGIFQLERSLNRTKSDIEKAASTENYERAAVLRIKERELQTSLDLALVNNTGTPEVLTEDVARVLSAWTGIPLKKLTAADSKRLLDMEAKLHERIIGQEEAVGAAAKAIRRSMAGVKDPNRPIASFLFCGPTGVGKTELTKALAKHLFDSEDAMIRLDMSEYMERYSVSRLVGAPPGYIGHDNGGQLTEAVRRRPYSVVLFDEIDKADPQVTNLLLQILEDGRLTDSKGRVISFKNVLIILTSNLGSKQVERAATGSGLGFNINFDGDNQYERMKQEVNEELKNFFRPEFLNRLDDVIVFRQLTKPQVRRIADVVLESVKQRCLEKGFTVHFTEDLRQKIVKDGYDAAYGARPLRRVVTKTVEDSIAEGVLDGGISPGRTYEVDVGPTGNILYRIAHHLEEVPSPLSSPNPSSPVPVLLENRLSFANTTRPAQPEEAEEPLTVVS